MIYEDDKSILYYKNVLENSKNLNKKLPGEMQNLNQKFPEEKK